MRRIIVLTVTLVVLATACHDLPPGVPEPQLNTTIVAESVAAQRQADAWAEANGAPRYYRNLIPVFWRVARARGVRADGAFAQSALETNFGKFTGVVPSSHRNPCGLKVTAGGPNDDPDAHARFPNWTTGITACVDHLALYAGAPGYPRASSPDPRHFASILGTAPTFESLGGRWAPSEDYGSRIVNHLLLHMILDHR